MQQQWCDARERFSSINPLVLDLKHIAGWRIDAKTVTLGPWLQIDRENERFKDNEEANRLVRGFYREPFVVPDLS